MMKIQQVLDVVQEDGLIAGMRGDFGPEKALEVARVLLGAGIRSFELTMNSVEPIAAMQAIKAEFGDSACVGMGTVLSVEVAHQVIDAGADFVVSPAFQPDVVQVVLDADLFMAPGVATPSEAVAAWGMGVPMLKLFPIGSLGLDYFKAMFGPLNHMKYMCNGGMTDENVGDFLNAGAKACGMAGWLTGDGSWSADKIRERADRLVSIVQGIRVIQQ